MTQREISIASLESISAFKPLFRLPQSPVWIPAPVQAPAPFPNCTSGGESPSLGPDQAASFLHNSCLGPIPPPGTEAQALGAPSLYASVDSWNIPQTWPAQNTIPSLSPCPATRPLPKPQHGNQPIPRSSLSPASFPSRSGSGGPALTP